MRTAHWAFPETRAARDRRLSENHNPKHHLWPKARANRDAELDKALRELGDEVLNQEIPERLLRVLRSAKEADKKDKQRGA
jgi:hypothetical protein